MRAGIGSERRSRDESQRKRLRKGLALWTVGALVWSVVVVLVVPLMIEAAHRGVELPIVTRALAGRAEHPVETYLAAWRRLGGTLSLVLAMVSGALVLAYSYPRARTGIVDRVLRGSVPLDSRQLVSCAICFGLMGGVAEALYLSIRQWATHRPGAGYHVELLWMAPLSSALVGLLVALVLVVVSRAGSGSVGLGPCAVIFGTGATASVLQSEGVPLHWFAVLLLSAGAATRLAGLLERRADAVVRHLDRLPRTLAVVVVGLGIAGVASTPDLRELRASAGPDGATGPNLLVIIFDTVRAHELGLFGYARATTPYIDEWARSAVVFERATATAPWTLPSHASMFTGRYNTELGTGVHEPLDRSVPTLAEVLTAEGYRTAGFVGNLFYTSRTSGLSRGFQRYEDYPVTLPRFLASSWLSRQLFFGSNPWLEAPSPSSRPAAEISESFLDWVSRPDDRPFMAFLNYFDAHAPYSAPEPWRKRFGPGPASTWREFRSRWRTDSSRSYGTEQAAAWVDRYDGAISYLDRQFQLVLESLDGSGVLDNTIVVLASDHGEMFGEHGELDHVNSLYDPLLHVPLIIWYPDRLEPRRVEERVSLRDLSATMLRLLRLPSHSIPGAPLIDSPALPWNDSTFSVAFSSLEYEPSDQAPWAPAALGDMASIYEGDLHYILNGDGTDELYRLDVDHGERVDRSGDPEYRAVVSRLRGTLEGPRASAASAAPSEQGRRASSTSALSERASLLLGSGHDCRPAGCR